MVFIYSLYIHLWELSLNKHLLRIHYVSGTVIAVVNTKLNKSSMFRKGDMRSQSLQALW